jgi:tetratricopeptide (TPR) repeat protein
VGAAAHAVVPGGLTVDTARWDKAGNIFERLLGAPEAERTTLLDTLCGEDAELRRIVESMLSSEDSALRFEERLLRAAEQARLGDSTSEVAVERGEVQIGPWRLARKIGSGGMGVVWLAERADGQFEQRAALKLIKRGMDSEAVLKRFLRERQILARLDHPHIAHLLDGGIAADGRPYFAMEYTEGLPLLRYCSERECGLEERLRLFIEVCAAVQFAHEHHVVHRDLKPSNVLVTNTAGVKLLDFGIAKLLDTADSSPEAITHLQRERPMTPAYAAPEQIRGDAITEATDIYALGCVLYELLTGQRTHDFSGALDPKDVLRIIDSTAPVAPSQCKADVAPVPPRRLRGDLDTIALTALRREPARRYPSVAALAGDLQSFLAGNPISARRDSVFYRGYKYVRRHRAGLAMTVMVAAIAAAAVLFELRERPVSAPAQGGAAMAIVDFNNLSQNTENAWLAPALAEMLATELAASSRVHVLPDELVRSARADLPAPLVGGYAGQSLAKLRKRLGADYVLSGSYLVSGSAPDASLRVDLALQDARTGIARATVVQSGPVADLTELVEKAGASLRAKSGFAPVALDREQSTDKAQPPNVEVARRVGLALNALREYDPARARDELLQAEIVAPGYAPTYLYLAQAWKDLGFDARALAAAKQAELHAEGLPRRQRLQIARQVALQQAQWSAALEADRALLHLDPGNPELQLDLAGDLLKAGDPDQADAALAKLRSVAGGDDPRIELAAAAIGQVRGDPKSQIQHAESALRMAQKRDAPALAAKAKRVLGIALDQVGEHDRAASLLREAIADFQRSANPKGEAGARTSLAILLAGRNQPKEARAEYQSALDLFQRVGDRGGTAAVYSNIANLLWDSGDRDGAETAARRILDIRKETGDIAGQAWATLALGLMKLDDNASDATLEAFSQAIALDEQAGEVPHELYALEKYAEALQLRGNLGAARDTCERALAAAQRSTNPSSEMQIERECAAIALDRGEVDRALAGVDRATRIARDNNDPEQPIAADFMRAQIEFARHRYADAVPRLERAIAFYSAGERAPDEAEAQALLALCLLALDRPQQAEQAAARARDLRSAITIRMQAAVIDRLLAVFAGESGHATQAATRLLELAADADRREWVAVSLEARLAALQLMVRNKDPAAGELRARVEDVARRHGFGWILQRLPDASKR